MPYSKLTADSKVLLLYIKNMWWQEIKNIGVGTSVGFLVLSIFRFYVLPQWFTFQFSMSLSVSYTWR